MLYLVLLTLVMVLGGANCYLAHRIWRGIHYFVPGFSIAVPMTGVFAMLLLMILGFFKAFHGGLQRCVSFIGSCWMGIFLYLLLFFLLSDVVILLVRLLRLLPSGGMEKFRASARIGAAALALMVSAYGVYNGSCVRTVEYDVQLSEQPTKETTVALISDVHLGAVGSEKRLRKIVDEINQMAPDMVCIAGDLFDTDYRSIVDPEKAMAAFRQINAPCGVYACLGNHDAGSTLASMEEFMQRAGIQLLKDSCVTIENELILAGRLDRSPIGGTGNLRRGEIADVLRGADEKLPVVIMDHNPMDVDTYSNAVDLILSGHTHRGQVFPGSLITDAMYAVDYGYYRSEQGVQAIVSSGAGTWGLPMRVGTHCEVVKINLAY